MFDYYTRVLYNARPLIDELPPQRIKSAVRTRRAKQRHQQRQQQQKQYIIMFTYPCIRLDGRMRARPYDVRTTRVGGGRGWAVVCPVRIELPRRRCTN